MMAGAMAMEQARSAIANVCRCDATQEALELRGACDERLACLVELEAGHLGRQEPNEASLFFRSAALNILRVAVGLILTGDARERKWLDAVQLFDSYCSRQPEALKASTLGVLCVAVARLSLKSDESGRRRAMLGPLHHLAATANAWLQRSGHATFSPERLLKQEQAVLSSVGWRTSVPTVPRWIELFLARLDVFTAGMFANEIAAYRCCTSPWAPFLAGQFPATADFAPRSVAQGLICLACVASGLLPREVFAPCEAQHVAACFAQSCPRLAPLGPRFAEVFVAALLAATGSDYAALQLGTKIVQDALSSPLFASHYASQ